MTRPSRPRSKRRVKVRRSSSEAKDWRLGRVIGALLAGVLVIVWLAWGGPTHGARLFTHLALAGLLIGCALAPPTLLASRGLLGTLFVATAIAVGIQATGLIPLPAGIGGLVSPGWSFDRGEASWDWSSLHVGHTLLGLASTVAVAAAAVVAAVSLRSRRWMLLTVRLAGCVFLFTAIALRALPDDPYGLMAPPFVDNNHFGAAFAVTFPALVGGALQKGRDISERLAWGIAAVVGVLYTAMLGSQGPVLVCLVVAVPVAFRQWRTRAVAALALVVSFVGFAMLQEQRGGVTHGRLEAWSAGFRGLLDHWLLGSGSGTFEVFLQPYRLDHEFHSWNHAHNDWLEWIFELGLVGAVGVVAILVVLAWPRTARSQLPEDRRLLGWCLVAFLLDAATEFPFHLPLLALGAAVLYGWWRGNFYQTGSVSPLLARAGIVTLALANLVAGGIQLRSVLIQRDVARNAETREAPQWLGMVAPHHELQLTHEVKLALREGDPEAAGARLDELYELHLRNPSAMRAGAALSLVSGMPERAVRFAERAKRWGPSDERNWVAWAETISKVHPERTLDVWSETLVHGFHVQEQALDAFPNGIAWAVRIPELSRFSGLRLARLLVKRDAEAAVFAFEALRFEHPDLYPVEYLKALIKTERWEEAAAYWEELPTEQQRSKDALMQRARIAEALGDHETASRAWNQIWLDHGDTKARSRGMELIAKVSTPAAVVTALDEIDALHGNLTLDEVILLADAHRRQGAAGACAAAIASRDFTRAARPIRQVAFRLQARCHRPEELDEAPAPKRPRRPGTVDQ